MRAPAGAPCDSRREPASQSAATHPNRLAVVVEDGELILRSDYELLDLLGAETRSGCGPEEWITPDPRPPVH